MSALLLMHPKRRGTYCRKFGHHVFYMSPRSRTYVKFPAWAGSKRKGA